MENKNLLWTGLGLIAVVVLAALAATMSGGFNASSLTGNIGNLPAGGGNVNNALFAVDKNGNVQVAGKVYAGDLVVDQKSLVQFINDVVAARTSSSGVPPSQDPPSQDVIDNSPAHQGESVHVGSINFAAQSSENQFAITGSTGVLAASYRVKTTGEPITINQLKIVNSNTIAFEEPESTTAVSKVIVKLGNQEKSASLFNGQATLSGLNFKLPANSESTLEVLVDVTSRAAGGENVTGQTYRLSVVDVQATGDNSQQSLTANLSGITDINAGLVVKSYPTLSKAGGLTTNITGVDDVLYGLNISADEAGPISFARIAFQVENNTSSELRNFKFFEGPTLLEPEASFYPESIPANSTGTIVVSFGLEQTVNADATKTYYLKSSATGAVLTNEEIITQLLPNGNGTYLNQKDSLVPGFFNTEQSFRQKANSIPNFMWSDKSADLHNGSITGSADWFNSYLLSSPAEHRLIK